MRITKYPSPPIQRYLQDTQRSSGFVRRQTENSALSVTVTDTCSLFATCFLLSNCFGVLPITHRTYFCKMDDDSGDLQSLCTPFSLQLLFTFPGYQTCCCLKIHVPAKREKIEYLESVGQRILNRMLVHESTRKV